MTKYTVDVEIHSGDKYYSYDIDDIDQFQQNDNAIVVTSDGMVTIIPWHNVLRVNIMDNEVVY